MQSPTNFEKEIKVVISEKVNNIYPSENMLYEIKSNLNKERKFIMNTNKAKKTRGTLVACIILILTTVTCFAAVKIASYEGYSRNIFSEFPSEKELVKEAGFLPNYCEEFSNGYIFKSGSVGEMSAKDENGNSIKTTDTASFEYENKDLSICLTIENATGLMSDEESGEKLEIKDGIQGVYSEYMNKSVPGDYELTEQDKKDQADGKYIFSFGSDEIKVEHIQSITWEYNGMTYNLGCYDDGLNKEEMLEMVKEVVNLK
ncbi:MAG: hypothetical protein ACK5MV_12055 [Aminipila sp.]